MQLVNVMQDMHIYDCRLFKKLSFNIYFEFIIYFNMYLKHLKSLYYIKIAVCNAM